MLPRARRSLLRACRYLLRLSFAVAVVYGCLLGGRLLSHYLLPALPASILGMILLTTLLLSGMLKLEWVTPASDLLVRWMSLLFLPIGVGLVDQLPLLRQAGPALALACVIGSIPVLWLSAWMQRFMKAD